MKKFFSILFSILFLLTFTSCSRVDDSKRDLIMLSKERISLTLFGNAELVASVKGDLSVEWINGNDKVVSLVENGNKAILQAIGCGNAIVSAKCKGVEKKCIVTVEPTTEKLVLTTSWDDGVNVLCGSKIKLNPQVKFSGKVFKGATIKYQVGDDKILDVSADGEIVSKSVGQTNVMIIAEYLGYTSNIRNIKVNVIDTTVIKLNAANLTLYAPGGLDELASEFKLEVAIQNGDHEIEISDYTVSNIDDSVAVLENNVIKAKKQGFTQIRIEFLYENKTYSSVVFVTVVDELSR